MKILYKLSIVALLTVVSFAASAQNTPVRFGVEAGVNLSNASVSDNPLDNNARVGFQFGITADYALTDTWYIQSGLAFTTKGMKAEGGEKSLNYKYTVNQNYLQLPVYAAYKIEINPTTRFVLNAGPYIALGVGGSTKSKDGYSNVYPASDKIDTFGSDGMLNNFDFGAGFGAGFEFGKIVATLRYELGILDISQSAFDRSYRNQNASLTLGYKF